MKKYAAMLCVVCLLIPALSDADQPNLSSLESMLTEETINVYELHSIMAQMLSAEGLTGLSGDEITTGANLLTYTCYYIAFSAIIDFIDCLVYYDISYDCRSAIINGLDLPPIQ